MTFREWAKSLGYALTPNELYRMKQGWEAAKADIKARLENHAMVTIFADAYEGEEWHEIGTSPYEEVKKIIGE